MIPTYSNIKVVQKVIFREWVFHDPCFELISYGWMAESCQPLIQKPWLNWRGFPWNSDQVLWEQVPSPIDNLPAFESLVDICQDTTSRSPSSTWSTFVPSPGSRPLCFTWATSFMKPLITMVPKIWLMASWMVWAGWFFFRLKQWTFQELYWGYNLGYTVGWYDGGLGVSVPQWQCPLQVSELWCSIQV